MTALDYLIQSAKLCGHDVVTEYRATSRGVVITPQTFTVRRIYGQNVRIVDYRCQITSIGEEVANGKLFDSMEALSIAFEKDQTAGGNASEIIVGQWNAVEMDKNYATFQATITVKE